jgi:HlyD family secretion protein/macrolide-specific efflux system membrane fusion protein
MKKVLFYLVVVLVLAGSGVYGFQFYGKKHQPRSAVKTAVVEKKDMKKTILATGTVKPMVGAEVKVGARVSGQVDRLFVKVGDHVKKGAIIAIVEHDDLIAKVDQSRAHLAAENARLIAIEKETPKEIIKYLAKMDQAKANVRAEKAKLEAVKNETPKEIKKLEAQVEAVTFKLKIAENTFKRDESLKKKGIVSAEKYDTSLNELEVLKAELRSNEESLIYTKTKFESDLSLSGAKVTQVEANLKEVEADLDYIKTKFKNDMNLARARVAQAKASLKEIEIDLSYSTIKSPISGIIASISTQEGETVAAGLNSPTFVNIIDMNRLQINAFVDETDIGYVKTEQEALFTVDTYADETFEGTVKDIYPKAVIQENVVNYEVIIDIPDSAMNRLRPEMTTSVSVIIGKRKGVLAVPKGAVKRKGKNSFVLVKNTGAENPSQENPSMKKDVKTGWRDEGFIEIKEGLKFGDVIIVADKDSSGFDHGHVFGGKK